MDQLLTTKQVAKKLNLSERTVKRMIERREIASIKVSGAVRFREEWLENWLNKRTVKAKV